MNAQREGDPFRAVHRARRHQTFALTLAGVLAASALAAVTWLVPAAVADPTAVVVTSTPVVTAVEPSPSTEAGSAAAPGVDLGVPAVAPAPGADGASTPATVLAAPPPSAETAPPAGDPIPVPPAEDAPPTVAAPPREVAIAIDTTGYQLELDRCLWVRMDLVGSVAPIVGAHNNCGGEIVLDLQPGDVVELRGENLEGRYVVTESRNGRPGQNVEEATTGLRASVILQTCYFEGPDVRLVALVRVV